MNIDINAPIIPFVGMGNIKLYATIDDLSDVLSMEGVIMTKMGHWIRYQIGDAMYLFIPCLAQTSFIQERQACDRSRKSYISSMTNLPMPRSFVLKFAPTRYFLRGSLINGSA